MTVCWSVLVQAISWGSDSGLPSQLTPVFESDGGLPVPWSLIVQGEELPKALPRVWRAGPVPYKLWSFRTRPLSAPFPEQGPVSEVCVSRLVVELPWGPLAPRTSFLDPCSAFSSLSPSHILSPTSALIPPGQCGLVGCPPACCNLEGSASVVFCVVCVA